MKLYRELDKVYEQYEVENTDYIIEICEEPIEKNYIEVWLYRQGYGTKTLMFCIKKENEYLEVIEENVEDYIKQYEKDIED